VKKKVSLYVATGALLGVAFMLFPFVMLVGYWSPFNCDIENYLVQTCSETAGRAGQYDDLSYVSPYWQSNVVHVGLIVLSGFVPALIISLYFKKSFLGERNSK
jgi:hypothetical protein